MQKGKGGFLVCKGSHQGGTIKGIVCTYDN